MSEEIMLAAMDGLGLYPKNITPLFLSTVYMWLPIEIHSVMNKMGLTF